MEQVEEDVLVIAIVHVGYSLDIDGYEPHYDIAMELNYKNPSV